MSTDESDRPRVALACQGGGSHTAFTAGVLDRLLEEDEVEFEVVELSGTSGGAICAFVTWFALARHGRDEGRPEARRLLSQVWSDVAADRIDDAFLNAMGVGMARAQSLGFPMPTVSPYDLPVSEWSQDVLRNTLEDAVDPDELAAVVGRTDPLPPRLDVGAVDINRGSFKVFTEQNITHDAVLASAAVPPLFRATSVTEPNGRTRRYWDGLFSQNPPLGNPIGSSERRLDTADQRWIIQINPQRRDEIPRRIEEIQNRRNELGGNLSVNQELRFIRLLNKWTAQGALTDVYQPVEVKTINLAESVVSPNRSLDYPTKLDRTPQFLDRLWEHGREQAERFLATERDRRRVKEAVESTWAKDEGREVAAWYDPDFDGHVPTSLGELQCYLRQEPEEATPTFGQAEYVEFATALKRAVPDATFAVEEVVAEPGKVATRFRGTGTHTGPLLDVEPTGRKVTLSGMRIDHLVEGRLTESWTLFEQWGLLRQLAVADPADPLSTASRVVPTPVVTQLSAPAENEELARAEVAEVWNEGQRESLDRLFDDECVLHLDDETDVYGPEAYWEFVRRYRDAFSDLDLRIEDVVSEGDKIVLRQTLRGTHDGPFLSVEPTGNRIEVSRMGIHHLDDGYIVETGMVEDTVRLVHQLGASPTTVSQ